MSLNQWQLEHIYGFCLLYVLIIAFGASTSFHSIPVHTFPSTIRVSPRNTCLLLVISCCCLSYTLSWPAVQTWTPPPSSENCWTVLALDAKYRKRVRLQNDLCDALSLVKQLESCDTLFGTNLIWQFQLDLSLPAATRHHTSQ